MIKAQRVVKDEHTPIRWTIIVKDRMDQYLHIEDTTGGVPEQYTTSELIELARKNGFGEWQQSSVAEREAEGWEEDAPKIRLRQYQIPDTKTYLLD